MSGLKKEVGKRIAEIRKKSGDSQAVCAEKLGIKRGTLAAYEAGTNGMPDEVKRHFIRLYDVSYEFLISGGNLAEEPRAEYKTRDLTTLLDQLEKTPLHSEIKRRVLKLMEQSSIQKDKIIELLEKNRKED